VIVWEKKIFMKTKKFQFCMKNFHLWSTRKFSCRCEISEKSTNFA
jgi:hypothetical protein